MLYSQRHIKPLFSPCCGSPNSFQPLSIMVQRKEVEKNVWNMIPTWYFHWFEARNIWRPTKWVKICNTGRIWKLLSLRCWTCESRLSGKRKGITLARNTEIIVMREWKWTYTLCTFFLHTVVGDFANAQLAVVKINNVYSAASRMHETAWKEAHPTNVYPCSKLMRIHIARRVQESVRRPSHKQIHKEFK